jgi:hypothetical protein
MAVGPAGEDIHTDEFGRVRVHWDRESHVDDNRSYWLQDMSLLISIRARELVGTTCSSVA